MFLIDCPNCARREASEFVWHGEDKSRPVDGEALSDEAWAEYLYVRTNPAGIVREWWFHAKGCGEWLVAERDTLTNRVVKIEFHDPPARRGREGEQR